MTRPEKKTAERNTLDLVLSNLALTADSIDPGETPDFVISTSDRSIGIEITLYQSGTMAHAGIGRRQVESEWEVLEQAATDYRTTNPDIRKINIGLMFKSIVPQRREHSAFIEEIAAFVRCRIGDLQKSDAEFWPQTFTSPLMSQYLRTVYLRTDEYAVWHSNIVGGWVGLPDDTLAQIVAGKSAKNYREADETWLVIQSGSRVSEILAPLAGVTDFETVPGLNLALEGSPFARLYVLAISGLFEWRRSVGWSNLAPPERQTPGPSLDDLKACLTDPEWMIDPVAKADQVVGEILAGIRERDTSP